MAPPNESKSPKPLTPQSEQPNSDLANADRAAVAQLDGLLSLLLDLQAFEPAETAPPAQIVPEPSQPKPALLPAPLVFDQALSIARLESEPNQPHTSLSLPETTQLSENAVLIDSTAETAEAETAGVVFEKLVEVLLPQATPAPALRQAEPGGAATFLENSQESPQQLRCNSEPVPLSDADLAALEQLQSILVEPGLSNVRSNLTGISQKLGQLEFQLSNPDALSRLLSPIAAQLLLTKLADSAKEIAKSLTPVIDEMIRDRTLQDRAAMGAALATIIPDAITHQIRTSPHEVAKAIAPEIALAIKEQIRLDREAIANALAPEMGAAIREQVRLEGDAMVDALYPVIGHTIAKYMAEAIRAINEQVESALSIKGVQRKIRAKMQGVSEAELILQEALPFSIQAIFLVHKSSGLIIAQVQQADQQLEAELIGGMLTAIRSFVQEYIVQPGQTSELSQIEYGGCEIVLEVAGYCYLAVLAQGEPSKAFLHQMRKTLTKLIQTYGKPIERFEGDPGTISPAVQPLLETLLAAQATVEKKAKPLIGLLVILVTLLSAILIPWGIHHHRRQVNQRIETAAAKALAADPELAVYRLDIAADRGTLKLTGRLPNQRLRQQAEQIARSAAPDVKLENDILAVQVPPDPVLTAAEVQRVTAVLNQISGIAIASRYRAGEVTVEGTAIDPTAPAKIAQAFRQIPGVQTLVSTIRLQPPSIATRLYFAFNSAALTPTSQPRLLEVKQLLIQRPDLNLRIIGHSDSSGDPTQNQQLSLQRAKTVQAALIAQGVDVKRLQAIGNADAASSEPLWTNRYVEFEAVP